MRVLQCLALESFRYVGDDVAKLPAPEPATNRGFRKAIQAHLHLQQPPSGNAAHEPPCKPYICRPKSTTTAKLRSIFKRNSEKTSTHIKSLAERLFIVQQNTLWDAHWQKIRRCMPWQGASASSADSCFIPVWVVIGKRLLLLIQGHDGPVQGLHCAQEEANEIKSDDSCSSQVAHLPLPH